MIKSIKLIFALAIMFSLTSCGGVSIDGNVHELKTYDTIAVIQFVVSPPEVPIFPLIDAAIYNSAVDEIVTDILDTNQLKANDLAEYTREYFNENTSVFLLCGQDYFNSPSYSSLKDKIEIFSTELDDADFSEMAIPTHSYNFFDVFENAFPLNYFYSNLDLNKPNETIAKIAKELNQKVVAIIVTGNIPFNPGFFSSRWGTYNKTIIFFYRDNGTMILSASVNSEEIKAKGSSRQGYSFIIDKYKDNLKEIIEELKILKK